MKNPFVRLVNAIRTVARIYSEPLRLELSLTDHCNLNCKGCTHYCPIAPTHFMPLNEIERNLKTLSDKDPRMFRHIYLLGGEPLMHPDLPEICRITRKYFPEAEIKILTNGLLVKKMEEDFWEACHATDAAVSVTVYPVKIDYAEVERICREKGVRYEIFHQPENGHFFSKHTVDDRNPGNKHINFLRCHQIGCLTLRGGRIYPCSTSAYADLLNKAFGSAFEGTAPCDGRRGGDYVEVEAVRSRSDLLRLKNRPTPFCRYCTSITPCDWAPSRRQPSEWLP